MCDLLTPCGIRGALLGDDATVLVLLQITLGQATRGVVGRSVPNAAPRTDSTLSLHYHSPRKFQAEGRWPSGFLFAEPRFLDLTAVQTLRPGCGECPHSLEPVRGSTAVMDQDIVLDLRVDLDAEKVLV